MRDKQLDAAISAVRMRMAATRDEFFRKYPPGTPKPPISEYTADELALVEWELTGIRAIVYDKLHQ